MSSPPGHWRRRTHDELRTILHDHIEARDFPCVGAKSALARGALAVLACRSIDSARDDLRIHDALMRWAGAGRDDAGTLRSFAVIFEGPMALSEAAFEQALWARLQSLSDKDVSRGQRYDPRVSPDPDDAHFSLSLGGAAFFVIGLHPRASRPARRLARPALIFNPHGQFEQLRAAGKYEGMRDKILTRDAAIAGSANPMLARHGEASEARQYSGRAVADDWRCPFRYGGDA